MSRLFTILAAAAAGLILPRLAAADAVERISLERLRATHEKVLALAKQRKPVALESGYQDYRALLHVHSAFSHDSRGTIDEIRAAAKAAGVRVILFSEHPADHYDYFTDGHRGEKDGLLLVPGAETGGFLAYPTRSLKGQHTASPQEFADLVRRDDGLVFLSHLEERMNWDIAGLTGSEIYNTHADVKDELRLGVMLRTPQGLIQVAEAVKNYPQETFAVLQDYPAAYLKRFDELCQKSRLTGVAANDSHHNQGFRGRLTDEGKIQLEDGLGKRLVQLDPARLPVVKPLVDGKKAGDLVFELDLDPYERSFHHVSTHLLMPELSEKSVWEALKAGRAYVAFDWMADPTGFVFRADRADRMYPMGSEVPGAAGVRLRAAAPLAGTFKLVRDGKEVSRVDGDALDATISEPGNYRVEVWLTLAGETRPWILSNPIYVRKQ